MINENFRYFWRRTIPGGIWWENRTDALAQFLTLMCVPMLAIGASMGRLEHMESLRPMFEAYSHASWYVALPASIVAYVLAATLCNLALFLVLKALGFAIMVVRFRTFMNLAEREWLLAITDLARPTDLDKEDWLIDRIDEKAEAEYDIWLCKRFSKRA